MTGTKPQTGMFSATAAERHGTIVWADSAGREFEITAIVDPSDYKFPDAKVASTDLVRWVRRGRAGQPGLDKEEAEPRPAPFGRYR